jgi:hypothetical protein
MKSRKPKRHTAFVSNNAFTPDAIASDASWLPDMADCDERPGSAEDFVQAYLADPGAWHWSTDLLNNSKEETLKRALAVIARARLPDHQQALGQLGAGPIEDMMSEMLLDNLRAWMPFSEPMRYALHCVRMNVEPPALQQRLRAMLAVW